MINKCHYCQKQTNNPKFCSRSCAASLNNKYYPKRKQQGKCRDCSATIPSELFYCTKCKKIPRGDLTIKECEYLEAKSRSSQYALVRTRARATLKKLNISSCQRCGYEKHVQACHIKPISSFDKDTKVSEINSLDNLLFLCPNCHWEFDHNLF